jgi:hypothetical protein
MTIDGSATARSFPLFVSFSRTPSSVCSVLAIAASGP